MLTVRLFSVVVAMAFTGLASTQGLANDRVRLAEAEARMIIAPYAFGSHRINRWLIDQPSARYEIWTSRLDFETRIFHVVLRENAPFRVVVDDLDIRAVVEAALPDGFAQIAFNEEGVGIVETGLGIARYERFTASGGAPIGAEGTPVGPPQETACVGFILPFGGSHGGYPVNTVQGLYCDPAELVLPTFDIEGTLQAIGVKGIYLP